MQIVICEDDKKERENLVSCIERWAGAREIDVDLLLYRSAEEFLFAWPDMAVDIVFSDIKMKEMTGIELAERIREVDKDILLVFVTNFSQYVLRGYDVDALHYLIKPISADKLDAVLDKAYKIWYSREEDAIIVKNDTGKIKLFTGSIYYIEIQSHTAELHTDTEVFKMRKTAKELMRMVPSHFIRCHRSYIVNLLKVDCVYEKSLLLSSGENLPMSRNNTKQVRDAYMRLFRQ